MGKTQKIFFKLHTAFINKSTDLKRDTIEIYPTNLKSKNMSAKS